MPEVLEAIAIGQDWDGDVRIVLFVRLREGVALDDALCADIRNQIRRGASPRHVPAKILEVADIPRTKSGKIVELAVRDVVHGRTVSKSKRWPIRRRSICSAAAANCNPERRRDLSHSAGSAIGRRRMKVKLRPPSLRCSRSSSR